MWWKEKQQITKRWWKVNGKVSQIWEAEGQISKDWREEKGQEAPRKGGKLDSTKKSQE